MKVHAVGSPAASPSQFARPNITSRGLIYEPTPSVPSQPGAGGYTQHHAKFYNEYERWSRKASGGTGQPAPVPEKTKQEVAIRVIIGAVMPGQSRIIQAGVSITIFISCAPSHSGIIGLRRRT